MANKSGVSNQVISLPKGGGALHGIGEKFSPDPHTGTGNFTVPITLPPGRNGFQPQLNLVYSSGNGNGPFGLGWSLSIPGISRKTSKGIPIYDDSKDTFVLSGAEDLVPVKESESKLKFMTRYQPRTEGLFAKIYHYQNISKCTDYWRVQSKDGLVSLYGTDRAKDDPPAWTDPAVISNPAPTKQPYIFSWKLTETTDPFGNKIRYEYNRDKWEEGPHHWDQLYLKKIKYADYMDEDNAEQFLVSISFCYSDSDNDFPKTRPDAFSDYRAGFEIRTRFRCERIIITTHAGKACMVREYQMTYNQDPYNGLSLLSQIQIIGYDDDGKPLKELPPLEFAYTNFEPEKRKFFPISGPDMPPSSLANPDYEMADLMGNGLPDILEMNGIVRYWRNLGNGKFCFPREMKDAPAGLRLADPGVQLIDANGDGRIDLLATVEGLSGYYPLTFEGLWDSRSFRPYDFIQSFNLEDPEVRLVDLDGDGITDVVRSGSRLECFFNDTHKGWAPENTYWAERKSIEVFPNINFSDPHVKWADMSGDGLQDIVLVYDRNIEYWPNLGRGNWGKRIHMEGSPEFPYGYDPKRILIGDVDGDGLADIVYIDDTKVTLWINQCGNKWSKRIEINGTPPVSDMDAVRLVDILGSGVSGILWSMDRGLSSESMFFLDFTGGVKPYLLSSMDNNMGSVTYVEYVPSTHFYLEDQKQLKTRWKTQLPFPVQVVSKVEIIDKFSKGKLTTEYRYHHGYWDGAEREFRGFGMVEQTDTEDFENYKKQGLHGEETLFAKVEDRSHFSPPTLTKTWFHLGPIGNESGEWEEIDFSDEFWPGDPQSLSRPKAMNDFLKGLERRVKRDALRTLRGSILRMELYAHDGSERESRPYTVTENLYGLREESKPDQDNENRQHIFFTYLLAQRTTQWERGNDPLSQFSFRNDYDDYGQPSSQISIAVPRGRRYDEQILPGQPEPKEYFLATHTFTDYAQRDDDKVYIVDRVARTTTYEIDNNGHDDIFSLKDKIGRRVFDIPSNIISQILNFYDGPEFEGLPFGKIGEYGALVRTENMIFTEEILDKVYPDGDTIPTAAIKPPFHTYKGPLKWDKEYPLEFKNLYLDEHVDRTRPELAITPLGYGFADVEPYAPGYFSSSERRSYDFHRTANGKGLVLAKRDPLGNDTIITYEEPYLMLPNEVTDPVGLKTKAYYNYRAFQPTLIVDPNDNRTRYTFTPLGLLRETWILGKEGKNEGDQQRPSIRMEYDFQLFKHGKPIYIRTIRQVEHDTDETITTVEYSDGFGRVIQTRTQAESMIFGDQVFGDSGLPADQSQKVKKYGVPWEENKVPDKPNVVVSGWQTYDNKGRIIEKYEPFFSAGWEYFTPEEESDRLRQEVLGEKVTMYYDPRGHVIRTVNPDGSEQRVIYGVPADLANPDEFRPTPWEAYTYDANDNAGRTHSADSKGIICRHHWDTPKSILVDALGRTIESVERNRIRQPNGTWSPVEEYHTRSVYDIRGNLLEVTDAMGRKAFTYIYDLSNRQLRIESIDAGVRRIVLDARGIEIESRDSKGALVLHEYDSLNKPRRLWARDYENIQVTLREQIEYGDGSDKDQPLVERNSNKLWNRLGRLHKHYDEAGLLTFVKYDFKGNISEKIRQVISDTEILKVFDPAPANWDVQAYRVNWQPPDGKSFMEHTGVLLDAAQYRTTIAYDALNRIKMMKYPEDVGDMAMPPSRKVLIPHYNRAGALERVELDGKTYVEHIAYNAMGQRILIAYDNEIMTRYAYNPKTFRLVRMRTERYTLNTYYAEGAPLQDFAYEYDLVGNIALIKDRIAESGIPNTISGINALDRVFTYDPLYRLFSATGRECDILAQPNPWDDIPKGQDPNLTRAYTERYSYDPVGNMSYVKHQAGAGSFTKDFALDPNNNRLSMVTFSAIDYEYQYDSNGNLIRENRERHFEWDHSDRMLVYRIQDDNAPPSIYAHYQYDAGGQRVKKLVWKNKNTYEATIYIDGIFETHRLVKPGKAMVNNTLHVMDNQSRIAMVRVGDAFSDDGAPDVTVKYHFGDHLGSSNLVVDGDGKLINREEYLPYGETSFGSFARKRYRYTGKERDEESGLYYHGARYYAPWLGRWVNCDPSGTVDGINVYIYTRGNPLRFNDKTGTQSNQQTLVGNAETGWHVKSKPATKDVNNQVSNVSSGGKESSKPSKRVEDEPRAVSFEEAHLEFMMNRLFESRRRIEDDVEKTKHELSIVLNTSQKSMKTSKASYAKVLSFMDLAVAAGEKYDVDAALLLAIMLRESRGDPKALSYDEGHGKGLMQIDDRFFQIAKTPAIFDPKTNIETGAEVIRHNKLVFPNNERAQIAAYNASLKKIYAKLKVNEDPSAATSHLDYIDSVQRDAAYFRSIMCEKICR